ncbi:hypothetical protein AB0D14_12965 [Streptomyces sp. NPDC048484]|uniref:hypothetical protein n=1 Tax=Streptomyces sp. NPDC048484 TaxID=3155146 RepID=UPI00341A7B23
MSRAEAGRVEQRAAYIRTPSDEKQNEYDKHDKRDEQGRRDEYDEYEKQGEATWA